MIYEILMLVLLAVLIWMVWDFKKTWKKAREEDAKIEKRYIPIPMDIGSKTTPVHVVHPERKQPPKRTGLTSIRKQSPKQTGLSSRIAGIPIDDDGEETRANDTIRFTDSDWTSFDRSDQGGSEFSGIDTGSE